MEKEYGKLTKQQYSEVYALFVLAGTLKNELVEESKAHKNNRVLRALDCVSPWACWYDLPYEKHLALFLIAIGLSDELHEIASKNDPQAAAIELAQKDDSITLGGDDISDEELGLISSLMISNSFQIESIAIYGETLSQLLERAKEGDEDALFNGIWVDRSLIHNPWVENRIQIATFHEDKSFLSELSRAISRTRPRKSKPELDDLRFMHQVLMDSLDRQKLTFEKQYELLVDDLELYPDEGKRDVFAGFKRLIQSKNSKM